MKNVVYIGSSDFRELSRDDFTKLGLDHKEEAFPRGVSVEVSNAAAEALLDPESIVSGEFQDEEEFKKEQEGKNPLRAWEVQADTSALLANVGDVTPEDANENKDVESGIGGQENAQTEESSDSGTASGGTTGDASTGGAKTASAARSTSGRSTASGARSSSAKASS